MDGQPDGRVNQTSRFIDGKMGRLPILHDTTSVDRRLVFAQDHQTTVMGAGQQIPFSPSLTFAGTDRILEHACVDAPQRRATGRHTACFVKCPSSTGYNNAPVAGGIGAICQIALSIGRACKTDARAEHEQSRKQSAFQINLPHLGWC